jgi:uncharacterized membrane protein
VAVMGRVIGIVLLMMGLFLLFRGQTPALKWGIGLTAIGIIFLMNKIHKKEY